MRRTCFFILMVLLLPASSPQAQLTTSSRTGRVRGIVIDSLLGAPLVGATVRIPLAGRSTRSDSAGRFALDSVPPGEWSVAFHHAALDSLGISDLETRVRVFAGASATVVLATPSFETVRGRLCADTPDSLSPTVAYGGVRSVDAVPLRVQVSVSWLPDSGTTPTRRAGTVRTIPVGDTEQWVACGVPWGAWLQALVRDSTHVASALLELGPRGLAAKDLVLGGGVTDIAGIVRDEGGQPVRGARVSVVDTELSAVTDASGRFEMSRAPVGTMTLDVRAAGYRPAITAREGTSAPIEVTLRPLASREPGAPRGSDYLRLLKRQDRRGFLLISDAELAADSTVLATLVPAGTCRWWLDGRPVDRAFFLAQPRWSWRAVEIYSRGDDAPPEYRAPSCAVILLWSASADW